MTTDARSRPDGQPAGAVDPARQQILAPTIARRLKDIFFRLALRRVPLLARNHRQFGHVDFDVAILDDTDVGARLQNLADSGGMPAHAAIRREHTALHHDLTNAPQTEALHTIPASVAVE